MTTSRRTESNRENAQKSTGPVTEAGKQKSSLNGFKHGLTGQRMILQAHELEPYRQLTQALQRDYAPKTEIETQLVQKIIDCNMRLNRIAAIDCNLLNIGIVQNTRGKVLHDDVTETVIAQTRAWATQADTFDKLGRYEARISRQLLQYMRELDRIQDLRKSDLRKTLAEQQQPQQKPQPRQTEHPLASFCTEPQPTPEPRTMTAQSHPIRIDRPNPTTKAA